MTVDTLMGILSECDPQMEIRILRSDIDDGIISYGVIEYVEYRKDLLTKEAFIQIDAQSYDI